jgi:hypothetical protein
MRFPTFVMAALGLAAFAVGDIALAHHRDEVSLTLPITRSCSIGSMQKLQHAQTSMCTTSNTSEHDQRPCATSLFAYWARVPTANLTSTDFGGTRSHRFVAPYAEATPVHAAQFQDLGGRSQRSVAQYGEPTITPEPTLAPADAANPPFPTCSFDLSKGQYVCPAAETRTTLKTAKKD